jgi:hypothetical protein
VPDEVCAHFKDLGDYDYRPAREVAEGDENTEVRLVIDVDILGHIFEQSITDLERLRLSLQAGAGARTFLSAERASRPPARHWPTPRPATYTRSTNGDAYTGPRLRWCGGQAPLAAA